MELKLEPRDGYLSATVSGRASLRDAIENYKKAFDDATARRFDKILVDCSAVEGKLSEMEQYELGRAMAEYSVSQQRSIKVAKVSTPAAMTQFTSLVAANRGLTAESFSDQRSAVEWLKSSGANATAS